MCIQDWRVGRLIRIEPRTFTIGLGTSEEFPRNPQRVGITISNLLLGTNPVQRIDILVDDIIIMSLNGSHLSAHFTLATHGDLPTRKINVLAVGAALLASVTEYFMPEEYLQAAIEEFKRELGR